MQSVISSQGPICPFCRRVIHITSPKYVVKYHTAAENALSHCYRSYLEFLVESGLQRLFYRKIESSYFTLLLSCNICKFLYRSCFTI
ncbi:hypothetical protein ACS0TY_009004 [Phlomoides rotata]